MQEKASFPFNIAEFFHVIETLVRVVFFIENHYDSSELT